jgi:hypothetical protein
MALELPPLLRYLILLSNNNTQSIIKAALPPLANRQRDNTRQTGIIV